MRAHAWLNVGRRLSYREDPPIGIRPTAEGVYLVGTAGGPAGDDDLRLSVTVEAGRALRLRQTAATVVYAGSGTRMGVDVDLAAGAALDWRPEPVIATGGCHHRQETRIRLDPTARLDLTEVLVLGRHGEEPGMVTQHLVVDLGGRPLLRHGLEIGGPGWDSPAVLGPSRVVGVRLVVGGDVAPGRTGGEGWAWCQLPHGEPDDPDAWMLLAVGPDLPTVRGVLERNVDLPTPVVAVPIATGDKLG